MGDDIAGMLTESITKIIWDAQHPDTDDHPGEPNMIFTFWNWTNETLEKKGDNLGDDCWWWENRPLPDKISPSTKAGWVGVTKDVGWRVKGSVTFSIGGGAQIEVAFDGHSSTFTVSITGDNNGRYTARCYGAGDRDGRCWVQLGYNFRDAKVGVVALQDSPAAATFKNKTYCIYQGNDGAGTLFCDTWNGTSWEGDNPILQPNKDPARMRFRAALVEFKKRLYCLHVGTGSGGRLWYTSYDGQTWAWNSDHMNAQSSAGPAAVVYKDRLYCIHKDNLDDGGTLWYTSSSDGDSWSADQRIQDDNIMSGSPSAVVWKDKIYCFFQGPNRDGHLYYMTFAGSKWTGPTKVENVGISESPTALVVNDKFRVYHHGANENGEIWCTRFAEDAKDIKDVPIVGPMLSFSPAVAISAGGDRIHCIHHASGSSVDLWHVVLPLEH